ncbi:cell wall metabolism sensor histidine kinase WalK, partial [Candidatus Saccharibacteria bacterium]|nr:cell wall metabolism sensor histidine kinase WalK [Candidatus Saccharibacteria bacterium]
MDKMVKGGPIISPKTAQILRYAGLFVPVVLVAYGILMEFDVINAPHTFSLTNLIVISFWWLYVSILQFIKPAKSKFDSALRIVAYHLLTGAYLIFISGMASPFVACWLLLMIVSYIAYSIRGVELSTLFFVFVTAADIIIWNGTSRAFITYDMTVLVVILMIGFITVSISRSQEVSKTALHHSKAKEQFQRERVLTIINNMTDAVISTDVHGKVRIYNAASLSLLDTNEDLKGKDINQVLPVIDQSHNGLNILSELKHSKTVVKRDDLNYVYGDG